MKPALLRSLGPLALLLMVAMPGVLVFSALRTYRALDNQRMVFLRSRVAAIASQLKALPPDVSSGMMLRALEEEPALLDATVLEPPPDPARDPQADLWLGRELFHTASTTVDGQPVFRAFVPFHGPQGLRLARIDLDASAADFIVEPARQQLWAVAAGSMLFIALSLLSVWSVRRMIAAEHRQLELEYLAQIGKMSAVLAHEIRNPLGTIKGFAQLLGERIPAADADLLDPILSETERLERLVNDLLLYGRPCQPNPRTVTTGEVAERLRPQAEQMRGAAALEWRLEDVTFHTDVHLLHQALLNLLKNALEALQDREQGTVWLTAAREGAEVVWSVLDDGPGFSEEARARLFEPFHTSKAFGTGLGLAITRKITQALGGEFTAGDRPGGGAAVTLRLPLEFSNGRPKGTWKRY